jgi:hypothetical protein
MHVDKLHTVARNPRRECPTGNAITHSWGVETNQAGKQ